MNKNILEEGVTELRFIRINTGEDLISDVITVKDENGEYYVLKNPMKIVYMTTKQTPNRVSVSMVEWIFHNICSDQHFVLHPQDVITMGVPNREIFDYYYELLADTKDVYEKGPTNSELDEIEKELDEEERKENIKSPKKTRILH